LTLNVIPAFAVTTTSVANGSVNSAYGPVTLTEAGGTGPYTWSLATGSLTACGLTLSSGGVISGTPSAAATCTFTAKVTDSTLATATSGSLSITIGTTAPGAPTGLGIVAGNGSLALSWTAPANNGGSAITSYTVTCTPTTGPVVTDTVTGTPPATSVTLTTAVNGIVNGVSYSCSVTATNAVGTSVASGTASGSGSAGQCTVSGYYRTALGVNVGTPGGTCTTIETISEPVSGTNLSITDASQSVTLSGVSLGGEFQDATGNLQTVIVNDSRGT